MPVGIPKIPYVVIQDKDKDGKEDETWVEILKGVSLLNRVFDVQKYRGIMIHQPLSTFFDGNPIIHTREINEVLALRDMIVHMYMGTTLQSHMQLLNDLERDEFMSTQDAIFYGLIDSVSQDPFACIDMERIRYDINAIKRDDGDTPSTSAFGVGDNFP
uniref:ATP-dependent Clp protease proteolytic subunit n=1 Tax=Epipremnum aureum TaxID=78380 RepID=A0A0M4B5M6_9ARAE|nr:ATP-dependent Clp protease proteolytic subunit [Epipremnum aureum]ALB38608.1 ATP-dependent Clp protease proteolytic subunit [Epipremnum aureum]